LHIPAQYRQRIYVLQPHRKPFQAGDTSSMTGPFRFRLRVLTRKEIRDERQFIPSSRSSSLPCSMASSAPPSVPGTLVVLRHRCPYVKLGGARPVFVLPPNHRAT
jgi:hypothetical protein